MKCLHSLADRGTAARVFSVPQSNWGKNSLLPQMHICPNTPEPQPSMVQSGVCSCSAQHCKRHQRKLHVELLSIALSFRDTWPPCHRAGEGLRSQHRRLPWSRPHTAPTHKHTTHIFSSTPGLNRRGTSKVHTPFQTTQIQGLQG